MSKNHPDPKTKKSLSSFLGGGRKFDSEWFHGMNAIYGNTDNDKPKMDTLVSNAMNQMLKGVALKGKRTKKKQEDIDRVCSFCYDICFPGDDKKFYRCSGCSKEVYCSVECRKKHWDESHKINCERMDIRCISCKKIPTKRLICSRCKKATYCSIECQTKHWKKHRHLCVKKEVTKM